MASWLLSSSGLLPLSIRPGGHHANLLSHRSAEPDSPDLHTTPMLPITYAIRNLFRDPGRLLQTVGGSALVVLLVIAAAALNDGMEELLKASGSSKNVLLVGSGSEESVERSEVRLEAEAAAAAEDGPQENWILCTGLHLRRS